jgi:hypothetical protein
VSRLALKNVQVYGIPIKIHECASKADAIKYLQATAEISDMALAIVDVVMETEHAGLDVCKFIRDELNNRVTPIVVRTGQAGKAPEREVIERYDISTYLTTVEATNEKLHATVVNAIHNYQYARIYEVVLGVARWLIQRGETRDAIVRGIPELINNVVRRRDGKLVSAGQYHCCFLTDRESIGIGKFAGQESEARALRARLAREPATVINASGDQFTYVGDRMLLSLARTETMPTFDLVGETNFIRCPNTWCAQWPYWHSAFATR